MTGSLDGRVAFVTGAASGLGRTIAVHLADAGAAGLAFDVAEHCPDLPGGWLSARGDVASEDDLTHALGTIRDEYGRLDVVVANAGVVPTWSSTQDLDLEQWDRVFDINVKGVAATIKHSVPLMKASGGSIIVMGSLNSRRAHGSQCLYTATKHAVLGIVRATALDLGRHGIRVNALGPGPIATDALVGRVEARARSGGPDVNDALARFDREAALGRIATEDDVARAALFLASDLSAGVTGQILPVDAGLP